MRIQDKSKTALIREIRDLRRDYKKLAADWITQMDGKAEAERKAAELAAELNTMKRLFDKQTEIIEGQEELIKKQSLELEKALNIHGHGLDEVTPGVYAEMIPRRKSWKTRRPFTPRRH